MGKTKTSFKAGNLAAEKWTEENALYLADELIEWMKKEDPNIFYEDFLYIEKDLSINEEIEKMRLSATSSLLSGRRDVLVVASVSCIYGIGNPVEFQKNVITLKRDQVISRTKLLHQLVQSLYSRTEAEFKHGNFRIKGDTVDIFPSYGDDPFRIHFFGDEIEDIEAFNILTNEVIEKYDRLTIYPANMFVTSPDVLQNAIHQIQEDMVKQVDYFKEIGKHLEAKRLKERTEFDLEMIRELGYCSGIENYSRYLDGRQPGTRPFCLLDYFLMILLQLYR